MKKIQVTAVELSAQSEVIVLNSSFVARTVRAAESLKYVKNTIEQSVEEYELDADGNRVKDANGKYITKLNFKDKCCALCSVETEDLYKKVIPFIENLCAALLGEEAER